MIVLANQNRRQIPKRRHIKRLEQLPLVRCSITVHGERHSLVLGVLLRKGQPATKRNLSSDDTVAAIETVFLLVEMHGATFPLGTPRLAAHEFGEALK